MAKQINAGVGGVKKVSKAYAGVGGVVKQIKKGVAGVGGVVKEFYTAELVLYDNGTTNYTFKLGTLEDGYVKSTSGGFVQITSKVNLSDYKKCKIIFKNYGSSTSYPNGIVYLKTDEVSLDIDIHDGFHRTNDADEDGYITCTIDISEIASTLTSVTPKLYFTRWKTDWLTNDVLSYIPVYKWWFE